MVILSWKNTKHTEDSHAQKLRILENKLMLNLESRGYLVLRGSQIIEMVTIDYEKFFYLQDEISFEEWLLPVNENKLDMNELYVVDSSISFEPVSFHKLVTKEENNNQPINKELLQEHIKNLLITKKGVEYHKPYILPSSESFFQLSIYKDKGTESYLEIVITKGFFPLKRTINLDKLETNKDLLNFINEAFNKKRLNIEAKTILPIQQK